MGEGVRVGLGLWLGLGNGVGVGVRVGGLVAGSAMEVEVMAGSLAAGC